MEKKVFITRQIPEIGIKLLREKFQVDVFSQKRPIERPLLLEKVKDCDAVITLLSDTIDAEVFENAKNLKIVANYAVGYDNIDLKAAGRYGVMVTNTPGVLTNATGEIAFALLISLTRKILEADQFTREGKFIGWDPMLFLGDELTGKTMGIIGMGRIGRDMAKKCRAFGMKIIYHNRKPVDAKVEKRLGASYSSFEGLLQESDAISIHTPLNDATYHLLNHDAFERMRKWPYIINTARGEVIDERALISALKAGKLRGAGLDVYEGEPRVSKELFHMGQVILLPHIGSGTQETRARMSEMAAKNVIAALEGREPKNLVF